MGPPATSSLRTTGNRTFPGNPLQAHFGVSAALVFAFFQAMYWAGSGVLAPLATSMIADVSEINKHRTGVLKDGSYAAVFSFFSKAALSVGLLLTGLMLDWAGIVPEATSQTAAAARNVALVTFISGPVFAALALLIILIYPVNRKFMMKIKAELAVREASSKISVRK